MDLVPGHAEVGADDHEAAQGVAHGRDDMARDGDVVARLVVVLGVVEGDGGAVDEDGGDDPGQGGGQVRDGESDSVAAVMIAASASRSANELFSTVRGRMVFTPFGNGVTYLPMSTRPTSLSL